MSHVNHELHSEFPQDTEILHNLKTGDPEFHALSEAYHELNRGLHRIETGLEAASDERLEDMKKQRLAMLDEVAVRIARAKG